MKTQIAAIEFGTGKIVTLIAQCGGVDRCEIAGSGTVPYDGYMYGDWNTPDQMVEKVRDSIAAAELEANSKVSEIYVGVPGEYVHVRTGEAEIELPSGSVGPDDVNAVQDAVADKLNIIAEGGIVLHRSPAWFSIDDGKKTMTPLGMKGSRLKAVTTFIIADPLFVKDVSEILGVLNISILGFLSSTLGSGILLLGLDDRDRAALLIDVGYLNTELSVFEGDAIVYHAVLPVGGGQITAELATELSIPMRMAEQIKRSYIFNPDEFDQNVDSEVTDEFGKRMRYPRERVAPVVEDVMDELCNMIDMTIRNDAAEFLSTRSQVFITGGGISMMRGGKEYLAEKISRPVKQAVVKSHKLNSPVYASAMGLLDIVFDSIEVPEEKASFGEKLNLGEKLKGLLRK